MFDALKKKIALAVLAQAIPRMSEAGREMLGQGIRRVAEKVAQTPNAYDDIALAAARDLLDLPPEGLTEEQMWDQVAGLCEATETKVDDMLVRLVRGLAGK